MNAAPVNAHVFYHDGRGPELTHVHWSTRGRLLVAIDYFNPDDVHGDDDLKHVEFHKPQVVMITPEEVIDYATLHDGLSAHRPAAMFDLGRSNWLLSFNQRHLEQCRHFQLMFYDELFDVICEDVICAAGGYSARSA